MHLQSTLSPLIDQSPAYDKSDEWLTVLADSFDQGLVDEPTFQAISVKYALGGLDDVNLAVEVNKAIAAGPAADMALDAIATLFRPRDVIELRAICHEKKHGTVAQCGRLDDPDERAAMVAFIRRNSGRMGVYFGENPRHASLAGTARVANSTQVIARRCAVLDFDDKDAPDSDPEWKLTIAALVADTGPALVVFSGGGHHVHYPISDIDTANAAMNATSRLRSIMSDIGADTSMAALPQPARLPFTPNLPNASKRKAGRTVRLAVPMKSFVVRQGGSGSAPTFAALCANIADVKAKHNLPGKLTSTTTAHKPTSAANSNGEPKTGQPAPSVVALRMAVAALPNDRGHFDDRDAFVAIAAAIKGAAIGGGFEADGREAFLDFAARWDSGGDPVADETLWDSIKDPKPAWGTLERTLNQINPAGAAKLSFKLADAAADATTSAMRVMTFNPLQTDKPAQIPPREWLYGRNTIRGYISVLVAPGGTGKSALAVVEALAMTTGRELLPRDKPHKKLRVWMHNAEDSHDEMQRRVAATMMHHNITSTDIGDRLFVTSGRDWSEKLARQGREGPEIMPGAVDAFVECLKTHEVDVFILDPLGAMHTLPENSNEAANLLMGALREIAERANVAIILVHHTSKAAAMDMGAAGAAASRGASAIVDGARVVRQLASMAPGDAKKLGVHDAERHKYVRIDNGKANLAPAAGADWVRLVGIKLKNGTAEYPRGDNVQTVERWTPPDFAQHGALTDLEAAKMQAAIQQAAPDKRRFSDRSPEWVGYLIGDTLGLQLAPYGTSAKIRTPDQEFDQKLANTVMGAGINSGWFIKTDDRIIDGKAHTNITIGTPIADVGINAVDGVDADV